MMQAENKLRKEMSNYHKAQVESKSVGSQSRGCSLACAFSVIVQPQLFQKSNVWLQNSIFLL